MHFKHYENPYSRLAQYVNCAAANPGADAGMYDASEQYKLSTLLFRISHKFSPKADYLYRLSYGEHILFTNLGLNTVFLSPKNTHFYCTAQPGACKTMLSAIIPKGSLTCINPTITASRQSKATSECLSPNCSPSCCCTLDLWLQ